MVNSIETLYDEAALKLRASASVPRGSRRAG